MHSDFVVNIFGELISFIIILALIWFGMLFLIGKAFGKGAASDVQRLGWRIIRGIGILLEKVFKALMRALGS